MNVQSNTNSSAIAGSEYGGRLISDSMARNLTLVVFWSLAFVSFSLPGRDGEGSVDVIGAAKILLRFGTLAWGFLLITLVFDSGVWRCRPMNWLYSPWCFFLIWAFFSVAWSALKTLSIAQALGLTSQILLAWLIAQLFTTNAGIFRVMRHLSRALLLYSAIFLIIYAIAPGITGLERTERMSAADGLVHPTAMGATSSLSIVLLTGLCLIGIESRRYWLIGLVIQCAVLYLSRSRAAMLCAVAILPCVLYAFGGRRWFPSGLLALAAAGCLILVIDPGFQFAEKAIESASEYVKRGQSKQQLAGGSGRFELWSAIGEQVADSPLIGHGYFVTSANGLLEVWDGAANRDAHNVVLQVLATTGLVGCMILAVATYRWLIAIIAVIRFSQLGRTLGLLLVFVFIWYLLWGIGCTTFMGPVRPESVVFFVLLGVVSRLYANAMRNVPYSPPVGRAELADA
jgi:O-antigen ligase